MARMGRRLAALAACAMLGALAAACGAVTSPGGAASAGVAGASATPTPTPPTGVQPGPTGGDTSSPGVAGITTTPSNPPSPAASAGGSTANLGPADDGRTITVARGARITVTLPASSGYRWTAIASTDSAVVEVVSSTTPSDSASAQATARQSGTASLQASDDPTCTPWGRPSMLWTVTVRVAP